jgi:hypothetical protein
MKEYTNNPNTRGPTTMANSMPMANSIPMANSMPHTGRDLPLQMPMNSGNSGLSPRIPALSDSSVTNGSVPNVAVTGQDEKKGEEEGGEDDDREKDRTNGDNKSGDDNVSGESDDELVTPAWTPPTLWQQILVFSVSYLVYMLTYVVRLFFQKKISVYYSNWSTCHVDVLTVIVVRFW